VPSYGLPAFLCVDCFFLSSSVGCFLRGDDGVLCCYLGKEERRDETTFMTGKKKVIGIIFAIVFAN
jgi:hypothetical protein